MYVYIYESHLGHSDYVSTEQLTDEDLYCETCGDCYFLKDEGKVEDLLERERLRVKNTIEDYRILQDMLRPYMENKKCQNK